MKNVVFHILTIAQLLGVPSAAHRVPTHVEVTGYVIYSAIEADGDTHIRLCDSPKVRDMDRHHCLIAECNPALPCARPKMGAHVTVRGISRWDSEPAHEWSEIHPVLSIEEAP